MEFCVPTAVTHSPGARARFALQLRSARLPPPCKGGHPSGAKHVQSINFAESAGGAQIQDVAGGALGDTELLLPFQGAGAGTTIRGQAAAKTSSLREPPVLRRQG